MRRDIPRRRFLAALFFSFAAASRSRVRGSLRAAEEVVSAPKGGIAIIDTHQHLWDLKKFRLPWLEGNPVLARNFLMSDYLEATKTLGIAKTVYLEVDVEAGQKGAEAEAALEACRRGDSPLAAVVMGGLPGTDGFAEHVHRFRQDPCLKGVRRVLFGMEPTEQGFLSEAFVRDIRLLGKMGLRFDLCVDACQLPAAAKLVDACPDTSFILDHCGNPNLQWPDRVPWDAWARDLGALAKRTNVVCKISGFVATARKGEWKAEDLAPVVKRVREEFGPRRIVFGSDWPVCTLAATCEEWLRGLETVVSGWSEEERRGLFRDNAERVYGLGAGGRDSREARKSLEGKS
jgi:L-fuconolactonase